ncbi:MAG: MFS transporter [Anaerolineales bacterium]|nr:MFS transporter [Anaerolineales bacterium]
MNRPLHWHDYITININWFALTTRSQTLTPLIIPLLVQQFVGEATKGTYVGILRLWTLMAALLFQALMGMLSDHSRSRWGRRRPFILFGVLFETGILLAVGFVAGLDGMTGYWVLFALMIFSMMGANSSHAATQALIPDLVPDEKKGLFSGIKAALELPVPLIFVSFVIGKLVGGGDLWAGLIALVAVLLVCMLITLFVPEQPLEQELPPLDWTPFLRLILMTGLFTLLILGAGAAVNGVIALAGNVAPSTALVLVGLAGLAGMAVAVLAGVWMSVSISIGDEIKNHSSFVWWVVNRLAFLVAATNMAGFMVFFLQEKFPELAGEQAAGPAAKIIMFVGIFILATAIPGGWLADRLGKKLLIAISGIAVALGAAVIIIAPNMTLIYLGACLVGGGVGFFYSSNWALGTEIVPKEQAGRYLGIQNIAGAGAGAIGAYIGGSIADNMSYMLLMGIYGLIALLSILALRGIQKVPGASPA